jgi:hypothetical protein
VCTNVGLIYIQKELVVAILRIVFSLIHDKDSIDIVLSFSCS